MPSRKRPRDAVAPPDEVVELLSQKAREGNVQAMKALLDWHERHAEPVEQPSDDWSAIYGDSHNVTPLRRSS